MADLEGAVSELSKLLQDGIDHPDDYGFGLKNVLMHSLTTSIQFAMVISALSQQDAAALDVLIPFAGTLGRFFKLASVRDKGGDMNGQPPPLTIATIDLAILLSNVLDTINESGSASIRKCLFKQVRTMPSI